MFPGSRFLYMVFLKQKIESFYELSQLNSEGNHLKQDKTRLEFKLTVSFAC